MPFGCFSFDDHMGRLNLGREFAGSFQLRRTSQATETFQRLRGAAEQTVETRAKANKQAGGKNKTKSSKQEGLFKQVAKAVRQLGADPRHGSLNTHEYASLKHPFDPNGKVFAAYAQNRTPGAYCSFLCYGPQKGVITILAITPHP
jgi:hypothetical protein